MRQFAVFAVLCLVASASADKLGYNYQPVGHSGSGLSFAPGHAASNVAPAFAPANNFGGFASPSFVQPSYSPSADSSVAGPSYSPSAPVAESSVAGPSYAAQPELEKEFFTYTADEGDFYNPEGSDQVASNLKKGLRVVFIKGPENHGLEDAALALAKQAAQQETAVYVLNKQADISDLANKLNSLGANKNNKPEVHFVKYRTPEDAANAQRAIQGQYDQLGGSSAVQDGGVASALNFASSAPAPVAASAPLPVSASAPASHFNTEPEASAPGSSYIPPATPSTSYLPASILRLFRL